MRYFQLIYLLSIMLHAIEFKETKFIEAFDLETYRYGNITYDAQKTIIQYKDGKTITKINNILTVRKENNELLATIDLAKKPHIALFFTLSKALFLKDMKSLKKNFDIKKKNSIYHFSPKGDTARVVNTIELSLKPDGSVRYFIIDFKNRDKIKIEAL